MSRQEAIEAYVNDNNPAPMLDLFQQFTDDP